MDTNKEQTEEKRTQKYIDEIYRLALKQPGVQNVLILNKSGVPIKTSMDREDALQHACLFDNLREKSALSLAKFEPPQPLTMLRIRTTLNEVIIVPDGKITILVIQNARDTIFNDFEKQKLP